MLSLALYRILLASMASFLIQPFSSAVYLFSITLPMTLLDLYRSLRDDDHGEPGSSLSSRLFHTFIHTWHLGITAFGGPPSHFAIFHRLFVEEQGWIDEQTV